MSGLASENQSVYYLYYSNAWGGFKWAEILFLFQLLSNLILFQWPNWLMPKWWPWLSYYLVLVIVCCLLTVSVNVESVTSRRGLFYTGDALKISSHEKTLFGCCVLFFSPRFPVVSYRWQAQSHLQSCHYHKNTNGFIYWVCMGCGNNFRLLFIAFACGHILILWLCNKAVI